MYKNILIKLILLIFLILTCRGTLLGSTDISNITSEVYNDFKYSYVFDTAKDSAIIFNKYLDNIEEYGPAFRQTLKNKNDYDHDIILDVIYILAVIKNNEFIDEIEAIRNDKEYLEKSRESHASYPDVFMDFIGFYYYRVDHNKEENLRYLLSRLNTLESKMKRIGELLGKTSFGFHLITFLPFFDSVDVSLDYIERLARNADGGIAELIHWAFDYLMYQNENNPENMKKIEQSYGYKLFIQGNVYNNGKDEEKE